MIQKRLAADTAAVYERHQAWTPEVASAVAAHMRASLAAPPPRQCLFLGAGTGVNDALPFARGADPSDRIVASDVSHECLERLAARVREDGLANVVARSLDVESELASLDTRHDLVAMLFVIHRCARWRDVAAPLAARVGRNGTLFVSEFAGPDGLIYRSNEGGGAGDDPVTRLIRRTWELAPAPFEAPLRSTRIGPFREELAQHLRPTGHRDFAWPQTLTVAEVHERMASRAYAPYAACPPSPDVLDRLRLEFASEWHAAVTLRETIRLYAFTRP